MYMSLWDARVRLVPENWAGQLYRAVITKHWFMGPMTKELPSVFVNYRAPSHTPRIQHFVSLGICINKQSW